MTSLYIHIPFCEQKCFYCSFTVSINQEKHTETYLDCLDKEAKVFYGTSLQSVYIGGGTPTQISCDHIARLFEIIRSNFKIKKDVEWTIEANPENLDGRKIALLKNSGVNRVSLGVQSLNDGYLKYLGRNHNRQSAISAFKSLRKAGFDNINVDLMFDFPNQTLDELKRDVDDMTALKSDHLSTYALTIEQGSRFHTKGVQLAKDQEQAQRYTFIINMLINKGYSQYEVSNFAKPDKLSKHNMNYWSGGNYVGLGVGAHSFVDAKRFWNVSKLKEYITLIQSKGSAQQSIEFLNADDQFKENLLIGLRMNQGVNIEKLKQRFTYKLTQKEEEALDELVRHQLLIYEPPYLKASEKGRLVLDEISVRLY